MAIIDGFGDHLSERVSNHLNTWNPASEGQTLENDERADVLAESASVSGRQMTDENNEHPDRIG